MALSLEKRLSDFAQQNGQGATPLTSTSPPFPTEVQKKEQVASDVTYSNHYFK